MSKLKFKNLALVFYWMVALCFFTAIVSYKFLRLTSPTEKLNPYQLSFKEFDVTRFEITQMTQGVRLTKENETKWWAESIPTPLSQKMKKDFSFQSEKKQASHGQILLALFKITHLPKSEPVSLKTEDVKFHINPYSLQIAFFEHNTMLARLFIGKYGNDGRSTYYKIENKPGIFWTPHDIRSLLPTTVAGWALAPLKK
jgi:hypothetical protein